MERTTTNSLVPFQPFQPGRNKLRHALMQYCNSSGSSSSSSSSSSFRLFVYILYPKLCHMITKPARWTTYVHRERITKFLDGMFLPTRSQNRSSIGITCVSAPEMPPPAPCARQHTAGFLYYFQVFKGISYSCTLLCLEFCVRLLRSQDTSVVLSEDKYDTKRSSGFTIVALPSTSKLLCCAGSEALALRFVKTLCCWNWPFIIFRAAGSYRRSRIEGGSHQSHPGCCEPFVHVCVDVTVSEQAMDSIEVHGRHGTHMRCTGLAVPISIDRPIRDQRDYARTEQMCRSDETISAIRRFARNLIIAEDRTVFMKYTAARTKHNVPSTLT